MLRKIRTGLAIVFFVLITLLFLDFSGFFHAYFSWMAKIQLVPAILALNFGVVMLLLLLTLLFGRVYCSVICPLGVYQDVVSRIASWRKKNRFRFQKGCSWMRYLFLGLFVVGMVAGLGAWASLIEPYSIYGRMVTHLFSPVYRGVNNLLALWAEHVDSYAFYRVDILFKGTVAFLVALGFFLVVTVWAWRNGRGYCNHICPVGTVLGLVSRWSLFRPVIDTDKCRNCHRCERNCKSSCIDLEHHQIDYSRCVACMDCLSQCKFDGVHYRPVWKRASQVGKKTMSVEPDKVKVLSSDPAPVEGTGSGANIVDGIGSGADMDRRKFLTTSATALALGGMAMAQTKVDGGLAEIIDKQAPQRHTPITPPGSLGIDNMAVHCTSCQLCISACPNHVLRPSSRMEDFMKPECSYEIGYCRPECTRCSEVCPAGAIRRISVAEKTSIQIGHAVWIPDNCVVLTDHVSCGNCARHCPSGAITMHPAKGTEAGSLLVPMVDTERCIGCGACENLCPARPLSAIYVEGHEQHRMV